MFSSPSIQIYSSENTENIVQRKAGSQLISRKPFIDRSVNASPFDKKLSKTVSKINGNKQKISPNIKKQQKSEDGDLDRTDFIFSGKNLDTYGDVWPPELLGKELMMKIFRDNSYPINTPPPSPNHSFDEIKPDFLDIDSDFIDLPQFTYEYEQPIPCEESFEFDLQEIEAVDLDYSI